MNEDVVRPCMHCDNVGAHDGDCMVLEYEYFVIKDGVILAGNEYEDDAHDVALDLMGYVVDLRETLRLGLHPFEISTWGSL